MALKSFSISFLVFLIALHTAVAGLPVDFSGEFEGTRDWEVFAFVVCRHIGK